MDHTKNKFTLKITFSYLLLVLLATIASFYVFTEIRNYISTDNADDNDVKLLKTSSFLTKLYEAESLSKLALQSQKKKNFTAYAQKIDSINVEIQELKTLTESEQQHHLLDSLQILLEKKTANNEALRKLKNQNQTNKAIDNALEAFDKMEASLGIITAEGLAPNLNELPSKTQETIRKVAQYLNDNIPTEDSGEEQAQKADSVLQASKALLKGVQNENMITVNSLAKREISIIKTDLELSQQLRNILSSFEKEIMVNSLNDNIKKEAALQRSIRLAIMAAVLGFLVVGIFIFILNRDFWKANLYRQKLEKEKKYSESLLKSREQLISTVSHDLRTPLNAISGYTELIAETGISRTQEGYVSYIKSATGYVNNLVNDLLDFSQLEAGKMKAEKISFNLAQLLMETAQNIAAIHMEKDIKLSLNIDDSLKQNILNDPFRIQQIVSNLIGNAYKFTKEGQVSLNAKLANRNGTQNSVEISVMDTGIGISQEQQKAIFNEFTQAKNISEKKYGGYGLGLTISKKLTELLGGNIHLNSTLEKGSTFTLELPIQFDSKTKAKSTSNVAFESLKNKRILIIDDDPSFLQMIGEMVKTEHMEAILINDFNRIDSLDLSIGYDLVLTDIEMPNVSGFEVLEKLTSGAYSHYENQPIIAMTGRHDLTRELFISYGFYTVIRKPFTKTVFLNALKLPRAAKNLEEKDKKLSHSEGTSDGKLYNLTILKSFLGDDAMSVSEVLITFLNDTITNTEQLKKGVNSKDILGISKTAHRMLPMFRQLQIKTCIPILELFEVAKADTVTWKKLETDFYHLEMALGKLILQLEAQTLIHPNHND